MASEKPAFDDGPEEASDDLAPPTIVEGPPTPSSEAPLPSVEVPVSPATPPDATTPVREPNSSVGVSAERSRRPGRGRGLSRTDRSPQHASPAVAGPDTFIDGNTQRSLLRPAQGSGGVWDERRVLDIERELDTMRARQKLLEKELSTARKLAQLALLLVVALAVIGAIARAL